MNEGAQPFELRGEDASTKRREPEVSPALVVVDAAATLRDVDQCLGVETPNVPVKISRFDLDRFTGVIEDRLANGVTVKGRVREHCEHEKLERPEGKKRFWTIVGSRHGSAPFGCYCHFDNSLAKTVRPPSARFHPP